jgi:AraC-like DNA-binding protein
MNANDCDERNTGVPCGWLLNALLDKGIEKSLLTERLPGYLENTDIADVALPLTVYNETIEWGAETLNNKTLGIELTELADPNQFGVLGYLVANATNIGDSLELITHYYRIFSHYFDASYIIEGDVCRYFYKPADINGSETQQDIDFSIGMLVNSIRHVYHNDWFPEQCSFTYPEPDNLTEHHRFFGNNLHFSQAKNFIAFNKEILNIPISESDPDLRKILKQHANQILNQISEGKSLVDHVKLLIASNLGTEQLNTASIASNLNMSVRNLHRLLSEKNTSFQQLRDQTTLDIAKEALLETHSSITDIALKLGFSESSAFVRKFKKQSGITPLQFRKAHKG